MKRLAFAIVCACMLGTAAAAGGGKAGAKGRSGALLSAAPGAPSAPGGAGRGGGGSVALGTGVLAGRALYSDPRTVPPLDPERGVSEQDCTKPVDLTRGNLKCK
jgi:hypothetical protein